MSAVLALAKLFDDVRAQFISDFDPQPCPVEFRFGWREPVRQDTQGRGRANRIVFVPGDDKGVAGEDAPAKYPGRDPRPLATLLERFSVYVWAYDGGDLAEDERAQYEACRLLYDAFRRAAYLHARTTFAIKAANWQIEKATRRLGAEIKLTCTIEAMVPDLPYPAESEAGSVEVVPVESSTVVRSGDVSETVNTP